MTQLIEFPLDDGQSVILEVKEAYAGGGTIPIANAGKVVAKAKQTFETAMEGIKPAAGVIIAKLREISNPPNEIEIEFGINLTASAGAIITNASLEANYKVKLIWKNQLHEQAI